MLTHTHTHTSSILSPRTFRHADWMSRGSPPTSWLMDDLRYLLSHSCLHSCMCTYRNICAFKHFKSLFLSFTWWDLSYYTDCIILLVLRVFVHTYLLWPLTLSWAETPKPHVNSDNGGLRDSGNCCLSAQWKERLSCNGPPVGSVCKLLSLRRPFWATHLCVILVGCWIWTGPVQLEVIAASVKVSQCFCCIRQRKWSSKFFQVHLCCFVSACKLSSVYIQAQWLSCHFLNDVKDRFFKWMIFNKFVIVKLNVTLTIISCFLPADIAASAALH